MADIKCELIRDRKGSTISVREYDCGEYVVKIRTFVDDFIPETVTFFPKNSIFPAAEVQNGKCLVFFQSSSCLGYQIPELVAGLQTLQAIILHFCGPEVLKK